MKVVDSVFLSNAGFASKTAYLLLYIKCCLYKELIVIVHFCHVHRNKVSNDESDSVRLSGAAKPS